ncbi:hypothetical protein [Actinomadura sp. KC345]|uniref:hypothetical protein n=1 Tax=Actinomadura sp. KC345 TaxID=2530371 RepID=UPI00140483F8|nr:hypothetical protein [Actinomadura sp. KC345]
MRDMFAVDALVHMILVQAMDVTVVHVIDVVAMPKGHMPASLTVNVRVTGVRTVLDG